VPTTPDERPPDDSGLIALTVAEVKRLFMLVTRRLLPEAHHLRWIWWRRRHQARARWFITAPGSADKSSRDDMIKVRLPY
jgi:hypothetical protein